MFWRNILGLSSQAIGRWRQYVLTVTFIVPTQSDYSPITQKFAIFSVIINGGMVQRGSGIAGKCITDVLHSISYHQPQGTEPRRLAKDV